MKTRIILLLSILISAELIYSQDFWQQTSFNWGGQVTALTATPNGCIFAGHAAGIFRSTDNGESWGDGKIFQTPAQVYALATDDLKGFLYAGIETISGQYGGIYRSCYNGNTWSLVGLSGKHISSIVVSSMGVIFAGSLSFYPNGGVYRSFDHGKTWTSVGLNNMYIYALTVDDNGTIYAGANEGMLYRSTDNGKTWSSIFPLGNTNTRIKAITINRYGHIFIYSYNPNGVYRSIDNGNTWKNVLDTINTEDCELIVNSSDHIFLGTVGQGVYRSQNNGDDWEAINSGLGSNIIFSLAINKNGYLFAGSGSSIYRSVSPTCDPYLSPNPPWIVFNNSNSDLPDPNNNVRSIAIDGKGNKWIGTISGGLAKYDWKNWTIYNTSNSGLPHDYVRSLLIDFNRNVWIGTWGGSLAKFDGSNWTKYNPAQSIYVSSLLIDGNENLWVGTDGGGLSKFDGTNWAVYNTGNSKLPDNNVSSLALDLNGNLWVGTYGGLAKFDNTNWTIYTPENSKIPSRSIMAIAADGIGNIWVGTWAGVGKLNGSSWTVYNSTNSNLPFNYVYSIVIDANGCKWFGTDGGGLAKFDGTNWTVYNSSNSGLPNNAIESLAMDRTGNLWIGTIRGGLAVYQEGGVVPVELVSFTVKFNPKAMLIKLEWQTATETNNYGFEIERAILSEWNKIGFVKGNGTTTIPQKYTFTDSFSTLNKPLCDNSINLRYRLKQIDFGGAFEYSPEIELMINQKPLTFNLSQNYPNPFNPATKIKFEIPKLSHVKLAVYDILGREVTTLVNKELEAGRYEFSWDANNYASGVYFYMIRAGSYSETRKMILIR